MDIVISGMALGFVAVFLDYVTVLNPARYIRKRFREGLETMGIIRLGMTRSMHPLAYPDSDQEDDIDSVAPSGDDVSDEVLKDHAEVNVQDFTAESASKSERHAGRSWLC